MTLFLLAVPLSLAARALAHGFVAGVTIDGQYYSGNSPGQGLSIVRGIADQNPFSDPYSGAITCGTGSYAAPQVANANPGSSISVQIGMNNQNWPHNTGPIITYLGDCGQVAANDCDAGSVKWFKIAEAAHKPGSGEWYQQDIMNGASSQFNLPSNLAAGNYLIRHEIIALHLLPDQGIAEFYPRCIQIKVGGGQTGRPNGNEVVTFPGGYSYSDAGLSDRNVYDNGNYIVPGPQIASLVAGAPAQPPTQPGQGNGQPSAPSQPDKPYIPEKPYVPEKPYIPEKPYTPEKPAPPAPHTPVPSLPQAPAAPSGSCRKKHPKSNETREVHKRNLGRHMARHHHNVYARST